MLSVTKIMVAGAVAAFCTAAFAAEQGACKADVEKLCKDVQPGEGRVLSCLKTHQADVSSKCAGELKSVAAAVKKVGDACETDIEKFCFDTPIGKGGIAKCLQKHSADLSADCKSAAAAAKSKAKEK
jgi:hypothetical protein